MALDTYANLITSIGDWLERSDTDTLAPDWIALAEAHMNRRLRVSPMITRASAVLSDEYSQAPSDFLQPITMRLAAGDKRLLQFFTKAQIDEFKAAYGETGTPQAYALVGDSFEYAPVPGSDVTVNLTYYARIPALTVSNTSNWVLARYPDAYLHGALLMAGIYYADDGLQQAHGTMFNSALDRIEAEDVRSTFAANPTPTPSQYAV